MNSRQLNCARFPESSAWPGNSRSFMETADIWLSSKPSPLDTVASADGRGGRMSTYHVPVLLLRPSSTPERRPPSDAARHRLPFGQYGQRRPAVPPLFDAVRYLGTGVLAEAEPATTLRTGAVASSILMTDLPQAWNVVDSY